MSWYGAAFFALIVGTASAVWAEQNLYVAPVEILESHPLCNGMGKIAYSITFDTTDIRAIMGNADAAQPALCVIRHRKAGQLTEIPIPCPEPAAGATDLLRPTDLAFSINLSGKLVGCFGLTQHEFVALDWRLSATSPRGNFDTQGDLTTPAVSVHFNSPAVQSREVVEEETLSNPPVWAIVLNQLPVEDPEGSGKTLGITTYLGLSEQELVDGFCLRFMNEPQSCRRRTAAGWTLSALIGGEMMRNVTTSVDQGKP
jgi:hypothetical protein